MGRRGPAPQPTALRVLRGNPGNRPLNRDEPKLPAPDASAAKPPAGLQGAGRAEWARLYPTLIETGVLTTADLMAFEDYCRGLSDLRRYEEKARRAGPELAIAKGYANQVVKLRGQVAQLRARLGLDPSSRSQVKAKGGGQGAPSKLSAFLAKKAGA